MYAVAETHNIYKFEKNIWLYFAKTTKLYKNIILYFAQTIKTYENIMPKPLKITKIENL